MSKIEETVSKDRISRFTNESAAFSKQDPKGNQGIPRATDGSQGPPRDPKGNLSILSSVS